MACEPNVGFENSGAFDFYSRADLDSTDGSCCVSAGVSAPTADPGTDAATYYDMTNPAAPIQYAWDDANGVWVMLSGSGGVDGSNHNSDQLAATYDTGTPPTDPANVPAALAAGDTVTEPFQNGTAHWVYDGANWTHIFAPNTVLDGSNHNSDQLAATYDTGTPPAAPTNIPANLIAGDTVTEPFQNGTAHWVYDGTNWTHIFAPSSAPRVLAGNGAPTADPGTPAATYHDLTDPTQPVTYAWDDANGQWVVSSSSCCVLVTERCDPNNSSAIVLVVQPLNPDGSLNGTPVYYNSDSTAFAGDTSALIDCPAGASTPEFIAFADSGDGCTPDVVGGEIAEQKTITPRGDIWEFDGAAWNIQTVSPHIQVAAFSNIQQSLLSADLDQWNIDNGNVYADFQTQTLTIENTDCVPLFYRAMLRTTAQFSAVGPSNQWNIRMFPGTNNNGPVWIGSPDTIIDTFNLANPNMDLKDNLIIESFGQINPGDTEVFEIVVQVQLVNFATDPNQRISINGFSGRIELTRGLSGTVGANIT